MEDPKVILSIIVPVYNVERYVRKCVDSLLNQDIDNYEIILVDDGSTDESGAICDEYISPSFVNSLTRSVVIKVIHQSNAGLSAARNSGIEVAQGVYIMFVDSDDYIEPNVLAGLMAQVEQEHLDVLHFDYQNVRMSSVGQYEVFRPYKFPHPIDDRRDVSDGVTYLNERMGYACYVWQWIISNKIVNSFTTGIHFEDVDWLPQMMLAAKRVNSTPIIGYNYLWREGSITLTQGNKDKIRRNVDDQMGIIEKYSAFIGEYPQCRWLRNMQSSMACGVITQVAIHLYADRDLYINRLCAWSVFPLAIADQGKTYVRRAKLINLFGPIFFCAIMNLRSRIL